MKAWMKLELISRVLILVSIGFQFLVLQPANDEFQSLKQQNIEDAVTKSAERFQFLSKKIEALNLINVASKTAESSEVPKEGIVIAAKAIVEVKLCAKSILGEARTSELYALIPAMLTESNLAEETGKVISYIEESEFDDILICFLEPYYEMGADVIFDIIQSVSEPLIEKAIVEPIFVIYHKVISWFNFVLFLIGSILATLARVLELKTVQ